MSFQLYLYVQRYGEWAILLPAWFYPQNYEKLLATI